MRVWRIPKLITDIFSRRYDTLELRDQYFQEDITFMHQIANLITTQLWVGNELKEKTEPETKIQQVHDIVALELGRDFLSDRYWWNGQTSFINSYITIAKNFLIRPPENLQDKFEVNRLLLEKFSFIELAFRHQKEFIEKITTQLPQDLEKARIDDLMPHSRWGGIKPSGSRVDAVQTCYDRYVNAFAENCKELNERFQIAQYPLNYHNGFIQISKDNLLKDTVENPFWNMVSAPLWSNVDKEMKVAIDKRDSRDISAITEAAKALESTIKIISDDKGWTTGNEKGASGYIDNLVARKNGRFIDVWEKDFLQSYFSDVRNPLSHGAGSQEKITFSQVQIEWSIDTAMVWIKSLIKRM